jgi:hypothetical protein
MKTTIAFILIIVFLIISFLIGSVSLAALSGIMLGVKLGEAIFGVEIN